MKRSILFLSLFYPLLLGHSIPDSSVEQTHRDDFVLFYQDSTVTIYHHKNVKVIQYPNPDIVNEWEYYKMKQLAIGKSK